MGAGDVKGQVVSIDRDVQRTDQGVSFTFSRLITALANDSNSDLLLVTPNTVVRIALEARVIAGAAHELSIREAATTSNDGAAATKINRRRQTPVNAGTAVLTTDPTVSGTGTLLSIQSQLEQAPKRLILAPNTKYLIRVTNRSGGAANSAVRIDFTETQ